MRTHPNVGVTDRVLTRDNVALVALLLAGVVGSGLMRYWFGRLGMPTLGTIVFVLGYGAMVAAAWYGWVRPLDLTGPGNENAGDVEEPGGSDGSGSR